MAYALRRLFCDKKDIFFNYDTIHNKERFMKL